MVGPGWEPTAEQVGMGNVGVQVLNNAVGAAASIYNTNKTIAANKALAEYQYQTNLEMWNRANEYNLPQNQMSRLQQAGLNPALVYGSGKVSGNTIEKIPEYQRPNIQYDYKAPQLPDLGSLMNVYMDIKQKNATIDNVRANTALTEQRARNEAINESLLTLKGSRGKFDLERLQGLYPIELDSKKLQLATAQSIAPYQIEAKRLGVTQQNEAIQLMLRKQMTETQRYSNLQTEQAKKEAEIVFQNYKNQFIQYGVTSSDNILVRAFARILSESGITPIEILSGSK